MDESTLLQQAIAAARAGRKAEARQLLEQVLQANPRHEQAWLWMGAVVETDAERVECLQQALEINPDNAAARKGLAQLQARIATPPAMPQPATPPPQTPVHIAGRRIVPGPGFAVGVGRDWDRQNALRRLRAFAAQVVASIIRPGRSSAAGAGRVWAWRHHRLLRHFLRLPRLGKPVRDKMRSPSLNRCQASAGFGPCWAYLHWASVWGVFGSPIILS